MDILVVNSVRNCNTVTFGTFRNPVRRKGFSLFRTVAWQFCATLLLLLSVNAFAQQEVTLRPVNVRAGPDSVFPLVTWFPARTPVHIFGCTSRWEWCDVASGRSRGWVHSSYLRGFSRDRTPIIGFSVEEYWDAHYRQRSWYADRANWKNWGSPSFRPPSSRH